MTLTDPRLAAARARLEVVAELASLINTQFDVGDIFEAAIPRIQRVLDFRRASIALRTEDGEHYYLHALYDGARGGFLPSGDHRFPLASGHPGRAMQTGDAIRVDEFRGTEGIRLADEGHISALIVPLRGQGLVIGTLNLGTREGGRYHDDDLELAVLFGRQIETSLHYSRMLGTIQRQREALAREHARLEALIEATGAAVLMATEGKVVYANHEMADVLGLPWEVLAGRSLDQVERSLTRALRDPGALAPQRAALEREDATLNDTIEFAFPRRRVCQRLVDAVHGTEGELLGHLVVYRDISREAEAQAAKDEFVSMVSHELRTPLASIKTSLSLLNRGAAGAVSEPMHEFLEIALRNLDRLIKLVNEMLDVSRIESGRIVTRSEPVALEPIAASAVAAVLAFAEERDVRLHREAPRDETIVLGDADRLEQVFINLLSNAIKYSPAGGVVSLRWREDEGAAVVEVADQGPGIPPGRLGVIFDKFQQLESAATRQHGGAGLGLYISKGIVERLGGRIWAESGDGLGSRFYVRLPLAGTAAAQARPPRDSAAPLGRVLLVHGDADLRRLLQAEFERASEAVSSAGLGRKGLATADEWEPDVIVVANELEDMHGLEFIRRLQRSPVTADIPTVLIGGPGPPPQAMGYGADGWVSTDSGATVEEAARVTALPRRRRVLYMEDDPSVRDVLARLLRRAGFACIEAPDGEVGLALARRRAPDIAVIDMQMPRLDGLAVLQEMRRDPALARVPAVFATGQADRATHARAAEVGVELLAKPVDAAALLEALERVLAAGTRGRPSS